MNKIFVLMGPSAAGKDTIFRKLLADETLGLKHIIPYTTRPKREHETDGIDYHFVTEETFRQMQSADRVIESRTYATACGSWTYFTADDGTIDLEQNNYLVISTPAAYPDFITYFGSDIIRPILIHVNDGERLQRALNRERKQKEPNYQELCRRFLSDSEDFSEETLRNAGIACRFENNELNKCIREISAYILQELL